MLGKEFLEKKVNYPGGLNRGRGSWLGPVLRTCGNLRVLLTCVLVLNTLYFIKLLK